MQTCTNAQTVTMGHLKITSPTWLGPSMVCSDVCVRTPAEVNRMKLYSFVYVNAITCSFAICSIMILKISQLLMLNIM